MLQIKSIMIGFIQKLFTRLSKFYNSKVRKKYQSHFFNIERYRIIKEFYKNEKYYVFGNVILIYKNLKDELKVDLNNTAYLNLFIISFKNNILEYYLDEKKYQKLLQLDFVNYIKIPINKEKTFEIKQKNNLVRSFNLKKKDDKNLILLLMIDGLSRYISKKMCKLEKYFNNNFSAFYSNTEWTLPSYSSLITGMYPSTHLNYDPRSIYSNKSISKINCDTNLYKFFSEKGFITGVYSPYKRINPTYGFFEGVDHGVYCKNYEAPQISNEILSHINFFKHTSNLIFAHYMDAHHPPKGFRSLNYFLNQNISNQTYNDEEIEKIIQEKKKLKNPFKINEKIFHDEKINSYLYLEDEIIKLLNQINLNEFDNYTILVFGDHGTRFFDKKNFNLTLNPETIESGLFIKDNKYNNLESKKKIQTIDIFPSLANRYFINEEIKNLNGKKTIFDKIVNTNVVQESIYPPFYELVVRLSNELMYCKFKFEKKEHKIVQHIYTLFLNNNFENIDVDNNTKNKFYLLAQEHLINCNLNIEKKANIFKI